MKIAYLTTTYPSVSHTFIRRELTELERQVAAWEEERNGRFVETRWRFTTADARIKLHRLYPSNRE